MTLELTGDERAVLADVIDRALGELAIEIAHTDNRDYRARLRNRRELLRALRDRIGAASAASA